MHETNITTDLTSSDSDLFYTCLIFYEGRRLYIIQEGYVLSDVDRFVGHDLPEQLMMNAIRQPLFLR